jgi:hypothetical protein
MLRAWLSIMICSLAGYLTATDEEIVLMATQAPTLNIAERDVEFDLRVDIPVDFDQIVGRDGLADITVPDPAMSRRYARLPGVQMGSGWRILARPMAPISTVTGLPPRVGSMTATDCSSGIPWPFFTMWLRTQTQPR